ncbi:MULTISPECIES: phage major capsid protein [Hyphomicrobiales]|uniref:phage major capsid protein n=1 Tax=Hyphomicrobiales TaxID=356 RepID=UPI001BCB0B77|nr:MULTISPECIES: phage major capsid protein [Hyphomicrobiales]CAH1662777.1 Phage capsid family protein [Hyphomicrobiales bacterium]MBS7741477.1 phage major capsid protein [Chelatococcus sp. HY11]MBX3491212.1 phage major capsid protein [Parvibaculum sp.]MBX3544504.1 phage major capsid protein [Chelatococcus sp.]MCO5078973.1 phage major capsid protein [Chelatococcus sp.]
MKHMLPLELRSADPIETRNEGGDDIAAAVQAVDELRSAVDQHRTTTDQRITTELRSITERLDAIDLRTQRPGGGTATTDAAAAEVREAFGTYIRLGNQTPAEELRALTVSSDPQAGYLAPPETVNEFIRDLVEFSPIRSVASVRTTSAPSVRYPRRASITSAQWEDELEESEESTVGFGMLEVPAHKLTTHIDISNELLSDSAGQAEAEVRLALAEDFGRAEAQAYVNGSGSKQPEGLMTNAEIQHTVNGSATAVSPDKLIEPLYALPPSYRNAPGARWAMNGNTLAAVRQLRDGAGLYLWQPSYQAGQPEMLLGKPVLEMVDLPDIGAGKFPIIFGDFSAYRIIDRLSLSVLSDPYTQARRGVTRIHATRRTGGRVLQAARFRKLKTATS